MTKWFAAVLLPSPLSPLSRTNFRATRGRFLSSEQNVKLSRARGRRAGALLLGRRVAVVLNIQINAAFPAIIRGAQGGSYLSGSGYMQVKPNERGPPQRRSIKVALMRSVHFAASGRGRRRMTNESHLGHLRRKLRAEAEGAVKPHISGQTIPYPRPHCPFRADVDGDAGAIETKSPFRPTNLPEFPFRLLMRHYALLSLRFCRA